MDDDLTAEVVEAGPRGELPRRRGCARLVLAVAGLLAVGSAGLLLSGKPQQRLVPAAVQRVLGAEVSMGVGSVWNLVDLDNVVLREPGAPDLPPLVRMEMFSMPWTLSGPRHVPSVGMVGLDIRLDGRDPQRPNYGWLRRFLAQPASGYDLLPWMPVQATAAPVRFSAEWPDGAFRLEGAGMNGLVLSASFSGAGQYQAFLKGDGAEIGWQSAGAGAGTFSGNDLLVKLAVDGDAYAGSVDLKLPEQDRIRGDFRMGPEGGDTVAEVTMKESRLRQPVWSELAAVFSPVPVRFAAWECASLALRLRRAGNDWRMEQAEVQTGVNGLSVGPAAAPWFFGDVRLDSAPAGKDVRFAATARVNALPPVLLRWEDGKDGFLLGASVDQWTPGQLAAASPLFAAAQVLPFASVSLDARLGPTAAGWAFSGTGRLEPRAGDDGVLTLETDGTWAGGVLSGRARMVQGEGTALALNGVRYAPATGRGEAAVTGPVDLAHFAKQAGFGDLWGTCTVDARVRRDAAGAVIADPLTLSFETLGYGGLGIPYGTPLVLSLPVRRDAEGVWAGPVEASLGAGTSFRAARVSWDGQGLSLVDGVFETDGAPLASKGWLGAAEGRATARCASLAWPVSAAPQTVEYEAAFARLDLPAGWGTVKGLGARGQLNWDGGGAAGSGTLSADEATVAGATLRGLAATVRLYGAGVALEQTAFGLFGGTVTGDARVAPLAPGLPGSFSVAVEQVDLAVFTEEYKPPSTRLTGKVGGRVSASLDVNGLTALDVDLKSDGPLTMNRELVERLLASEYLQGMSGGKRVEQVLRDVVGDAPEIPFSGAAVKLGLDAGRIAGTARLESAKLNLTLDIKADPGALLEALRARSGGAGLETAAQ